MRSRVLASGLSLASEIGAKYRGCGLSAVPSLRLRREQITCARGIRVGRWGSFSMGRMRGNQQGARR
jgi:hypothetical protein